MEVEKEVEVQIDEFEESIDRLKERIDLLNQTNVDNEKRANEATQAKEKAIAELNEYKMSYDLMKRKFSTIADQNQNAYDKMEQFKNLTNQKSKDREEYLRQLEQKCHVLKENNNSLNQQLNSYKNEINTMKNLKYFRQ